MGINAHARSEYAIEYVLKYMSERTAFGKTIDSYQALRHKIADLASEVEVCKVFNYSVAKQLDLGEYAVKEATMSKLVSTKVADQVAYDCLQLLGGYGYMEEYPMARLLRDSRLGPIGGGTSEILREIIAKIIKIHESFIYQPLQIQKNNRYCYCCITIFCIDICNKRATNSFRKRSNCTRLQ